MAHRVVPLPTLGLTVGLRPKAPTSGIGSADLDAITLSVLSADEGMLIGDGFKRR